MRNTLPLSTVVLNEPVVGSAKPSLSTGKPLVDQTTQDDAPGRLEITLLAISSILTMACPLPSCPVTTRRICRLIAASFRFDPRGLFDAGALEKCREDLRQAGFGVAPFLAVPFLQQIIVRALLDHIVVQLAVGNETGGLARGRWCVDDIIAGDQAGWRRD